MLGIDLEDGTTNWSEPFENAPVSPVIAGELAIVGGRDGTLRARDPETGDAVWDTALEGEIGVVVPTGDRLLTAGDGMLRCLH